MNDTRLDREETTTRAAWRWRLMGLAAVLLLAGGVRVGLIARSEVISEDGGFFLRGARRLMEQPGEAMRTMYWHPGYPAAVVAAYAVVPGEDRERWERAGQFVSLGASLLALAAVWVLGLWMTRDGWSAMAGAMLFGVGKKFTVLGASPQSDALLLACSLWALVFAVWAAGALKRRAAGAYAWAAGFGLLSGLAYLVKPEGLVVLGIGGALWVALLIRRQARVGSLVASGVVALLAAGACVGPYMVAIGGFTRRWNVSQFCTTPDGGSGFLATWCSADLSATIRVVGRFFEAQHALPASLTVAWLVLWAITRLGHWPTLQRVRVRCVALGAVLIVVTWGLILPPVVMRYWRLGVLSHRYLMLPAAMMAPLAGAGLVTLVRWALCYGPLSRRDPATRARWGTVLLAVVLIGCVSGLAVHASKPMHDKQRYVKQAGLWIAPQLKPGQRIASNHFLVQHYGGDSQRFSLRGVLRLTAEQNPSWPIAKVVAESMGISMAYAQETWGQRFAFVAIQAVYHDGESLDLALAPLGWVRGASFSRARRKGPDNEETRSRTNPKTIFIYRPETNR
jgi:hypothetical protein